MYAAFARRASRSEYWWWFLFVVLVTAATGVISDKLSAVFSLVFLLPGIAVGVRRLHDIDNQSSTVRV